MLTAVAARLVGRAEADDIVQETFLRALARPPDASAPVAPWLATVARHLAIDALRDRGRFVDLDTTDEAVEPTPSGSSLPALLAGLGALSRGEVTVLLLRDALDLDVADVATALGTSGESVRVLHHRARKKAAQPAPLDAGLTVLDGFLGWLLARSVAGLPVIGRAGDPGVDGGVLTAHLSLLDAIVAVAQSAGEEAVEGRARLSRGTARLALGRADAEEDLAAALRLGADPTLVAARLAPLLHGRGEMAAALSLALQALARPGHPEHACILHRVAAQVHLARGDTAAAGPHVEALRELSERDEWDAQGEVAQARIAMDEERFVDSHRHLVVALHRVRASGNRRREGFTLNNLAFAAMCRGELEEAAGWAQAGLALARELDDPRTEALILGNLATIAHLDGRLDEAAAGYAAAIARTTHAGLAVAADILRTRAASLAQTRGRAEEAASHLDGIARRLAELPGLSLLPRVHHFAALAELGRADAETGRALAAEAAALPSTSRAIELYRLLAAGDHARLAVALAEPADTGAPERFARAIVGAALGREKKGRRR